MKRSTLSQSNAMSMKYMPVENISVSPYAEVRKVTRADIDKTPLAMKKMKLKPEDSVIPPNIIRELAVTCELDSPFIAHSSLADINYEQEEKSISYVYEYGATDLKKVQNLFAAKKTINEEATKSIIFQVLLGLEYMHSRGISHCNITPAHLMIMPVTSQTPGILRFISFSLARVSDQVAKLKPQSAVPLCYRAPEITIGCPDYGPAADIWSVGCIFAEFLTGQPFIPPRNIEPDPTQSLMQYIDVLGAMSFEDFPKHENYANWSMFQQFIQQMMGQPQMRNAKGKLYQKVASINQDAQDLLFKMLAFNPDKRITAKDALRHAYFNSKPFPVMNLSRAFSAEDWKTLTSGSK